ncbi:hypothetical protein KBB06_04595 [Candidatus Gracilibacteria bacterium]|nr:hypothetical protein [Candidatus Gracilibacteria bacterium]
MPNKLTIMSKVKQILQAFRVVLTIASSCLRRLNVLIYINCRPIVMSTSHGTGRGVIAQTTTILELETNKKKQCRSVYLYNDRMEDKIQEYEDKKGWSIRTGNRVVSLNR